MDKQILLELAEELEAPAARDRLQAVRDLTPLAANPLIRRRMEELRDADPDVRVRMVAAEVLQATPSNLTEAIDRKRPGESQEDVLLSGSEAVRIELLSRSAAGATPETSREALEAHLKRLPDGIEAGLTARALLAATGQAPQELARILASDPRARVAAAGLGAVAAGDPASLELLLGAFDRASGLVRKRAVETAHRSTPRETLDRLRELLVDPDSTRRREAAQDGLFTAGDDEALELLGRSAVSDPEPAVARRAVELLRRQRSRRAARMLARVAVSPAAGAPAAREALEELCRRLGAGTESAEELVRAASPLVPLDLAAPASPSLIAPAARAGGIRGRRPWPRLDPKVRRRLTAAAAALVLALIGAAEDAPPPPSARAREWLVAPASGDVSLEGRIAAADPARRTADLISTTGESFRLQFEAGAGPAPRPGSAVRVAGVRLAPGADGVPVVLARSLESGAGDSPWGWLRHSRPAPPDRVARLSSPTGLRPLSSRAAGSGATPGTDR